MGYSPFVALPSLAKPILYNPTHLRRWRVAYAQADRALVPLVMAGDSIFYGIGADGTLTTSAANAFANGICGRLQGYFNDSPRNQNVQQTQGFLPAADPHFTAAGGATQADYLVTSLGQGYRLIGNTETLSITVPAGITSISVVQGNANAAFNAGHSGLNDVTGLYNINGGANTNLSALTNTNAPLPSTPIAVTAGQVFEIVGPATAQTYISGVIFGNGATTGVQIHRNCITGIVSATILGGQNSGVLQYPLYNGGVFGVTAMQSNYLYAGNSGLIMVEFGFNDQQFQNGGGTGSQNNVTIGLFQTWIQEFCNQAVSDGWCVLLAGMGRNVGYATGSPTLDQYYGTLKAISSSTDHVGFMDVGELWGTYTESQADGLQVTGDEHPNEAGHGDIAALIFELLNSMALNGITELQSG